MPAEPVRIAAELLLIERRGKIMLWRRPEGTFCGQGDFGNFHRPEELPGGGAEGEEIGDFRHSITHHRYTFFRVESASALRRPEIPMNQRASVGGDTTEHRNPQGPCSCWQGTLTALTNRVSGARPVFHFQGTDQRIRGEEKNYGSSTEKIFIAKTVVILSAIPVIIWAHAEGPDLRPCRRSG